VFDSVILIKAASGQSNTFIFYSTNAPFFYLCESSGILLESCIDTPIHILLNDLWRTMLFYTLILVIYLHRSILEFLAAQYLANTTGTGNCFNLNGRYYVPQIEITKLSHHIIKKVSSEFLSKSILSCL
jgi:hypothetical protein